SVRFRGSYQRADRAPNLNELFENGDQSFPPFTDRCAGPVTPAMTANVQAQCTAQFNAFVGPGSFTAGTFVQTNSQVEQNQFGNQNLSDEKSDTYTIGVVFQPNAWKNFRASVDWYDIKIQDAITFENGTTQNKIDQCLRVDTSLATPACHGLSRAA